MFLIDILLYEIYVINVNFDLEYHKMFTINMSIYIFLPIRICNLIVHLQLLTFKNWYFSKILNDFNLLKCVQH